MKLNYKRTIYVGFAFFLICTFWQTYDSVIPMILTNRFGLSQTASGAVMALDNVLALFMLPLFGAISDRCTSRMGRRTPFILVGSLVAVVAFAGLSFVDNYQLKNIADVASIDEPAALAAIYDAEADTALRTPEGDAFVLSELFTREEFCTVESSLCLEAGMVHGGSGAVYSLDFTPQQLEDVLSHGDGELFTNPHYTDYVVPARQAYAWRTTAESPGTLIFFIALLLVALVAMAVFRSPAVALMPDVTMKPLRSRANAVINLMGSAGGILVLALGMVFATGEEKNSMMSYTVYFSVICGVMLLALGIFLWKVREPRFVREMQEESRSYGLTEETDGGKQGETRGLGRAERRSLIFMLVSIVLWFAGYNAVISKYSVYATNILNKDYNATMIIAQGVAILSYLPVGMLASRVGRKRSILAGIAMLSAAFFGACFIRESSSALLMNCLFSLAGVGWATINVNSFPMVVEMCSGSDVGKYTGIYYTASMSAQTLTPLLSGLLMDRFGMTSLFPYATVFATLAFVTMLFVLHGDHKPVRKGGLEALDTED